MSFVVEDGTGLAEANSYASVEDADAYFAQNGNTLWTGSNEAKQAALVQASFYADLRYSEKYPGNVSNNNQGLGFPRVSSYVYDNVIPRDLKRAVYEYGVRALSNPLAPDPKTTGGLTTYVKSKKVGPLEYSYAVPTSGIGSTVTEFQDYPVPDLLMRKLLGTSFSGRVIR